MNVKLAGSAAIDYQPMQIKESEKDSMEVANLDEETKEDAVLNNFFNNLLNRRASTLPVPTTYVRGRRSECDIHINTSNLQHICRHARHLSWDKDIEG